METNKKPSNKFSPEVRARAVRMVREHRGDHASQWAAIRAGAETRAFAREAWRDIAPAIVAMREYWQPIRFNKNA